MKRESTDDPSHLHITLILLTKMNTILYEVKALWHTHDIMKKNVYGQVSEEETKENNDD